MQKPIMKRIYWLLILLFLVLLPAGYLCYESRRTVQSNEKQRQDAFAALRKSARCPAELLKTEEIHFSSGSKIGEKSYDETQFSDSPIKAGPSWQLSFLPDGERKKKNRITLKNGQVRVRSDSYAALQYEKPQINTAGCVFKVRVSGRGRISPYLYNWGNIDTDKKENEICIPPHRVSTLFAKDYYFTFPFEKCHDDFSFGIRMRGNLDIEEITVYVAEDSRKDKTVVVIGKILEASEIPEPAKSSYPDCLYTLKVKVLSLEKWLSVPREFILIAPAFFDRRKAPEAVWKPGDMLRFSMIRFQDETEKVRQIQQSDTLDDFTSERYSLTYMVKPEKVKILRSGDLGDSLCTEQRKYVSGYDRPQNPPLSEAEKTARAARIAAEQDRMRKILSGLTPAAVSELNRKYDEAWKENRKQYPKAKNEIFWCRKGNSYYALGPLYPFCNVTADLSRTIQSIKDLSDYLKVHGICMIAVVCPHYYDISARVMNPEFKSVPDYNAAYVVDLLLKNDVEALYFSDEILAQASEHGLLFMYPFDVHPASGVQQIAARKIVRYLKKAFPEVCKPTYRPEMFSQKQTPYPLPEEKDLAGVDPGFLKGWYSPERPVYYTEYLLNGKTIKPVPDSPLLLYSNSFLNTPGMDYLLRTLTYEMGTGWRRMWRPIKHPLTSMLLDLLNYPEKYLKGCKVCIYYVGVRHIYDQNVWNIRELDRLNRMNAGEKKNDPTK